MSQTVTTTRRTRGRRKRNGKSRGTKRRR